MQQSRRGFFKTTIGLVGAALTGPAMAKTADLIPGATTDQTQTLQSAIDAARDEGRLFIPAGRYRISGLRVPSSFLLEGVPGATWLEHVGVGPLLGAEDGHDISLWGLGLDGSGAGGDVWHGGLVHFADCHNVTLRDCAVRNTKLNGITFINSSGRIEGCRVSEAGQTGIFSLDAAGLALTGNTVTDCGNGGIRVWRSASGADGTLISGNRIASVDWTDGGNGQNGNGINVFQADEVIVSGNHLSDCAFSAIRLNATNNTQINGNTCINSGEVAIYSEFAFSGSVITGNVIDGAAAGISITNFNEGGRLAACTGNIVRNVHGPSAVNPDLQIAYGIAAEADTVVASNVIEAVSGTGITAGWGPYLRDVTIAGNLIRDIETGIVVSVAPGAGAAAISGNTISGARGAALSGHAWHEVVAPDLAAKAGDFPQLAIGDNLLL